MAMIREKFTEVDIGFFWGFVMGLIYGFIFF